MESWLRKIVAAAVKTGPVPEHVAFIMDGNRRWARRAKEAPVIGHAEGFSTLKQTLEWCLDLGVEMVTVYAFSTENFKRNKEEVDGLMKLAEEKFKQLLDEEEMIHKLGVRVKVLGDVKRLPQSLQFAIAKAVHISRTNSRATLNVCFVYTGQEEIASAADQINVAISEGILEQHDVSETLFEQCLYTDVSPPPGLIIRSSGEIRLSDFLLWQSGFSRLVFSHVLWPDFSFWELIKCFLYYQKDHAVIKSTLHQRQTLLDSQQLEADTAAVVQQHPNDTLSTHKIQVLVDDRQTARVRRVNAFIHSIQQKREDLFAQLATASDNRS